MQNTKNNHKKRVFAFIVAFVTVIAMTPLAGISSDAYAYAGAGGPDHHQLQNGVPGSGGQNDPGDMNDPGQNGPGSGDNEGALTIVKGPESAVYAVGNYAEELTLRLSGDDSNAAFQWYISDTEDGAGEAIEGATDEELDGDSISTAAEGTAYYYCTVADNDGNVLTSARAKIEVKALAITSQPAGGTYEQGKCAFLSVDFTGNGDVQWYASSDGSSWSEIDKGEHKKLKIDTRTAGTTYYKALATNGLDEEEDGYASVESTAAAVTVTGTESASTTAGQFKYAVSGDTATIVGVKKKTYTALTIPESVTINDTVYNVTAIGDKAFTNCKKLRKITIGANVASIGSRAFNNCKRMNKVTFAGTALTTVGSKAFKNTYRAIKFLIPSAQLDAYKALLTKSGVPHKAKFKAI